jgi:hypothetical protein
MPLSWLFGRKCQNASSQVQIRDKALQFFKRPLLCFDIWPMFTALLDRAFGVPLSLHADEDTVVYASLLRHFTSLGDFDRYKVD